MPTACGEATLTLGLRREEPRELNFLFRDLQPCTYPALPSDLKGIISPSSYSTPNSVLVNAMPTKTATVHESEEYPSTQPSLDAANGAVSAARPKQNGKVATAPVEDDSDLPDSEAETEHIDTSPTKKRPISSASTSPAKRTRISPPGTPEPAEESGEKKATNGDANDSNDTDESKSGGKKLGGANRELRKRKAHVSAEPAPEEAEDVGQGSAESNSGKAGSEISGPEEADSGAEQDIGADSGEEDEVDDEEQAAAQKQRQEAIGFLTDIEVQFAEFRNQVHEDQMARYELEIQMCVEGSHPELSTIQESIKSRLDDRVDRGRVLHEYQLECIHKQTKATRAHLHQQFVRERFDLRSELLSKTTRKWYQVNYERRAADRMVPDYGYRGLGQDHVSSGPVLAAIQKFAGFPAAPRVSEASMEEKNEDLAALGLC